MYAVVQASALAVKVQVIPIQIFTQERKRCALHAVEAVCAISVVVVAKLDFLNNL